MKEPRTRTNAEIARRIVSQWRGAWPTNTGNLAPHVRDDLIAKIQFQLDKISRREPQEKS